MPGKKEKQPLSVTHPELAKEADGWDASGFTAGSGQTKNWVCKLGHKWTANIANRTGSEKTGCPYCGNKKTLAGFNDLKTRYPIIAKEADGWDPSLVNPGTHKVLKWICKLGHNWETSPSQRTTRGIGCPFCNGRKVLSGFNDLATTHPSLAAESNGWDPAKKSAGVKGNFSWKCGKGHIWNASIPNRASNKSGCPVCAGKVIEPGFNDLATTHPLIAKEAFGWDPRTLGKGSHTKVKWICKKGHLWEVAPNSRTSSKSGCPACSGILVITGMNDLQTTHPLIAKEADGWDPKIFYHGSGKVVPWICPLGHRYNSSLKHRSIRGQGCPYCSGNKVLSGFNDLKTRFPQISEEADGWDPIKVASGSAKKFKWKCEFGHKWTTAVNLRTSSGTGCPTCSKTGFDPNQKSFLYLLENQNWEMFQIGITNDFKRRLSEHALVGWELIELRGPMDGHLTQQWETAILRMLKAKGADLSNSKIAGKFDGYSEAWSKSTFEVKSIKELMKLTEEFEEENRTH